MRLTFRAKLFVMIGPAALAFVILIVALTLLAHRMVALSDAIQGQYLPIIEFGPKLDSGFDRLRRKLQDSVAAQDKDGLERTREIKNQLLSQIREAGSVIHTSQVSALEAALEDYYQSAYGVSKRLLAGETGTELVKAMTEMQAKQAHVDAIQNDAFTFDRSKLENAFSSIKDAQSASTRTLIAISVVSLLVVLLFSILLSRSVLESLSNLSRGLERFGAGDFGEPIRISSGDEFELLASDANQMAARVRGAMRELESFSYSVAHDLRAPLRSMHGFSTILLEDHGAELSVEAKGVVNRIIAAANRMAELVDGLLSISRLARAELKRERVDLSLLVQSIVKDLRETEPSRSVEFVAQPNLTVEGDPSLLRVVLTNLIHNAWKYSSKRPDAKIAFGLETREGGPTFFLKDNGAGFDMKYASKLFGTFQRLHSNAEFEGSGIGLATVQTILRRHGGSIWAESEVNRGATFFFTIWRTVEGKDASSAKKLELPPQARE